VPTFSDDIVSAVLAHMNSDHNDDNLTIVRAFADPHASSATMTGLDESFGYWVTGDGLQVTLPWSVTISERPEIRREIVLLHSAASQRLGAGYQTENPPSTNSH
jgi:hypothetical protein